MRVIEEEKGELRTIEALDRPEHLLIWAIRTIAIGQSDCPLMSRTFSAACGLRGAEALAAYYMLVKSIGQRGRRKIQIHVPGCFCVSPDELAVVGVVAAAQASLLTADESLLRRRLGWLVSAQAVGPTLCSALTTGILLGASGAFLPLRLPNDFALAALEAEDVSLH